MVANLSQRPSGVFTHHLVLVRPHGLKHREIIRGTDVATHHTRVAPQHPQRRALDRRAFERGGDPTISAKSAALDDAILRSIVTRVAPECGVYRDAADAARHQYVILLDVAVHDAAVVRIGQCRRDLAQHAYRFNGGQLTMPGQART